MFLPKQVPNSKMCAGQHHTLLHTSSGARTTPDVPKHESAETKPIPITANLSSVATSLAALYTAKPTSARLATARVCLENEQGHRVILRALLDSGAQADFVTERMVQQLRLRKRKVSVPLTGLQNTRTGTAAHAVYVLLCSHDFSMMVRLPRFLIVPSLTSLATPEKVKAT